MITDIKERADVNTGRQKELDDAKGILLIAILLIHSFQVLGNSTARASAFYKIVFGVFMITGACLYLFTMGFGMAYSKKNSISDLRKNGVKLIINQFTTNIASVFALLLPLGIRKVFGALPDTLVQTAFEYAHLWLFFINIFFMAGVIYLVMALLKNKNALVRLYFDCNHHGFAYASFWTIYNGDCLGRYFARCVL